MAKLIKRNIPFYKAGGNVLYAKRGNELSPAMLELSKKMAQDYNETLGKQMVQTANPIQPANHFVRDPFDEDLIGTESLSEAMRRDNEFNTLKRGIRTNIANTAKWKNNAARAAKNFQINGYDFTNPEDVARFQYDNKLVVDGLIGKDTWNAMVRATGNKVAFNPIVTKQTAPQTNTAPSGEPAKIGPYVDSYYFPVPQEQESIEDSSTITVGPARQGYIFPKPQYGPYASEYKFAPPSTKQNLLKRNPSYSMSSTFRRVYPWMQ